MNDAPPVAATRPVITVLHGDEGVDPYAWLKDRDDPDVLAYLEAENAYTAASLKHTEGLQETLYQELVARIEEDDSSVPAKRDNRFYYWRAEKGKQYRIFCRRTGSLDAPEEILLDENVLAEGHEQFDLGPIAVSPNHRLLAYGSDTDGSENYRLHVIDLDSGETLSSGIGPIEYSLEWANDNRTLFYNTRDQANRPYRLWRHVLGTDPRDDVLVLEEPDLAFYLNAEKTRSGRYIVVRLASAITTEVHVIDADAPADPPRLIDARRTGIEYFVDHQGVRFIILTKEDAPNYRVVEARCDDPSVRRELIAHRPDVRIDHVDPFANHLVVTERENGLARIVVHDVRTGTTRALAFDEPTYRAAVGQNLEYDTTTLRFVYSSMVTPNSWFDEDMNTGARELRKQTRIPAGYDASEYVSERLWCTAPDGARVPISIVYRKDFVRDGSRPVWLYGYGAYGSSMDASFSPLRLPLLDRGFAFAIAHARGGAELGEHWHDGGKLKNKRNTFTDFIACAEHLIEEGYTAADRLVINGGSAGGLLMGAVVNMRPDLFKAAIAAVPFVDVINTIMDPNLLFSVMEYEEWGDPHDPQMYEIIRSYSPYENVEAKAYPAMFVTAGLNDPRVNYWEPAKWVARLRTTKTDANPLLLKTKMSAGHAGASGRYNALRDDAIEYAFALDVLGLA